MYTVLRNSCLLYLKFEPVWFTIHSIIKLCDSCLTQVKQITNINSITQTSNIYYLNNNFIPYHTIVYLSKYYKHFNSGYRLNYPGKDLEFVRFFYTIYDFHFDSNFLKTVQVYRVYNRRIQCTIYL